MIFQVLRLLEKRFPSECHDTEGNLVKCRHYIRYDKVLDTLVLGIWRDSDVREFPFREIELSDIDTFVKEVYGFLNMSPEDWSIL